MNPLVTVTFPLYNHEKYVKATLESILNQSFQNFEIVIVDDCSTDNSVAIVEAFKDPRIRLIKNPFNSGPSFAGSEAIRNAAKSSQFIAFFTSDDLMKPERLAKQLKFLQENPNYGAAFSQLEMIDERGEVLVKKTKRYKNVFIAQNYNREEWLRRFFCQGNCLASPTAMIRKNILQELDETYGHIFNPAIYQAQDFDLFVRICLAGYNLKVLPEELISLRKRDKKKNLSSDTAAVRSRLLFEDEKIINHYLNIDLETFRKTFLEAKIPTNLIFNKASLAFLLAQEALKLEQPYFPTNFAINALFSAMQEEKNVKFLLDQFGFSIKDFSLLMAKYPLGVLSETTRKKSFLKRLFSFL